MLLTKVMTTYNTGFTTTQDQFTSGDILFVNLYPDQTRNWFSLIPKKQVSLNDGGRFLSFRHQFLPSGGVRLVYNDSPSNLSSNTGDPVKMNNKQFCTVLANVSPQGLVSKTRLFDSDEIGHRVLVDGIRFAGDQIFFMAVSKKTFIQGTLDARTIN
jgi:hypothetical protein